MSDVTYEDGGDGGKAIRVSPKDDNTISLDRWSKGRLYVNIGGKGVVLSPEHLCAVFAWFTGGTPAP